MHKDCISNLANAVIEIPYASAFTPKIIGKKNKEEFKNIRKLGFIGIISGSIVGLFFFVTSEFWLWEINENWDVRPVAEFIDGFPNQQIFIRNSFERPSLNWYAGKQIKSFDEENKTKCKVIKKTNAWDLYTCND